MAINVFCNFVHISLQFEEEEEEEEAECTSGIPIKQ